jgi:hypothetical protein
MGIALARRTPDRSRADTRIYRRRAIRACQGRENAAIYIAAFCISR